MVEALIKAGAFDALHADRARALASVGLAFDWAETQAAHATQGGLFDMLGEGAHGSHTQEPPLAACEPWRTRERLMLEKTALGFYLSGHLFDEDAPEVRRFCPRRIADLIDAREPQVLAGIVTELRVVNGQRGRVGIFKLDDASEPIEAVIPGELMDAHRELLREDELIIVHGKVQLDRFSGGLRLNVTRVWDLAGARARFGRWLAARVDSHAALPALRELVERHPARLIEDDEGGPATRAGLRVRLSVQRGPAGVDIELGEAARFWPSDDALKRWRALAAGGAADIVYAPTP